MKSKSIYVNVLCRKPGTSISRSIRTTPPDTVRLWPVDQGGLCPRGVPGEAETRRKPERGNSHQPLRNRA